MQVDSDDEGKDTNHNFITSYSLKLPTVEKLLSQSDLQQETSTQQTKNERHKR